MTQPTKAEITEKLQGVLEGTYSREFVGKWALNYITNDDTIEIVDINAWHYLVDISSIDLMLSPTEYLYSNEDIKNWIKEHKEKPYKKIEIPPIYEEDIIEFIFKGCNATFKYFNSDEIVEIEFQYVYKYDYCDFECISDTDYEFGLMQYSNSDLLKQFLTNIEKDRLEYLFCGEYKKLKHFKLVVDDVGIYNFICKGINIKL